MFRPCVNPKTGEIELRNLETCDTLDDVVLVRTSVEANQGSISVDWDGIKTESKTRKTALKQSEQEEQIAIEKAISKNPKLSNKE